MDRGPRGLGTKKREYLALPVVAVANDYARSTLFERFRPVLDVPTWLCLPAPNLCHADLLIDIGFILVCWSIDQQ